MPPKSIHDGDPPWLLALIGAIRDRLSNVLGDHAIVEQVEYGCGPSRESEDVPSGVQVNFAPLVCIDHLHEPQGYVTDISGLLTTLDKVTQISWINNYCPHHRQYLAVLQISGFYDGNYVELCFGTFPVAIGPSFPNEEGTNEEWDADDDEEDDDDDDDDEDWGDEDDDEDEP